MSILIKITIICLFLAAFTSLADAEPDKTPSLLLEELVVSAAREKRENIDLPYASSSLNQQKMQNYLARSLPEALVQTPGVLIQKTANGQGSPYVRGFTGYRTLTMIDGIRYNNSVYRDGPNEYFSLIDIFSVAQIDVIRGPASTLYGSDAIGGTLYLNSPQSNFSQHQQFFSEAHLHYRFSSAEDSQISHSNIVFGQGQQWGVYMGASLKRFGEVDAADIGTQKKTDYGEYAINFRLDGILNQHWSATLAHQALQQNDVWRSHSTIYAISFAGTSVGDDLKRLKDQMRKLSYFKLNGEDLSPWLSNLLINFSEQQWKEDGNRITQDSKQLIETFDSHMLGTDIQLTSEFRRGKLIYGADFYRDLVDSDGRRYNSDGELAHINIQGPIGDNSRYDQLGAYVQYHHEVNSVINITVGSRFNRITADIGQFEDPSTGSINNYKQSWSDTVYSLKASLQTDSSTLLWASISESFRAPNIADISRYGKSRSDEFEVAAIQLKPETFLSYELGIKSQNPRLYYTASIYHTDISDFITSTPTGSVINNLTEVSKSNSASGYVQGIELEGQYRLSQHFRLDANVTWLKGRLETRGTASDHLSIEPMSRIMPLTATLGIHWQVNDSPWLALHIQRAEHADELSPGDITDTQRIPPGGTPAYTVVNISGGYKLNSHANIILGFDNVFDEAYRSHGSGSNEPGAGINIGIELTL